MRKLTQKCFLLSTKTNMSTGSNDYIVLFKAVSESENEDDDPYINEFRTADFQVTLIPVLDFEFVNLEELLVKLRNPDDYEGIIFTSPRCVNAVELSVRNENAASVLEKWENKKHFVVGVKTARMVEKFKFVPNGEEAGNAKNLAEIMSRVYYSKPFLYPKGSLTKDTFKLLLKDNQIKVDETLVYKTKPHTELETNLTKIKSSCSGKIVYFVYFSPSGVNFTLPLLQKHQFDLNEINLVAIGPTTHEALKQNGLKTAAVAAKPDPQELLDAVLFHKENIVDNFLFRVKEKQLKKSS